MFGDPSAIWPPTSAATSICLRWSLPLLPCEQSIITRAGRPAAASLPTVSSTLRAWWFGPVRVPPRRITKHVSLPAVCRIAPIPCLVTPANQCGCRADATASTAICTLPFVPFLKPTGIERPDASSRCTWLSVVRAPIAATDVRSARYCGIWVSRNSEAVGRPRCVNREQQRPSEAQALVDVVAPVEIRIVDEALPARHRARLLEVGPHHDHEIVGEPAGDLVEAFRILDRGPGVVNRAGADDGDQPRVVAAEDRRDRRARRRHG